MKTFSIVPENNEKSAEILCPVCGGAKFDSLWDCDGFSFKQCLSCGLLMQNPQPLFEALDKRYDEEYFRYEQENDQIFFELMLKGLSDIGFDSLYSDRKDSMSFLDIGCATGVLVRHFQDRGWISRGVELCGPAAEWGSRERNIEIFSGTVEQASFEDNSFDVVHCSHLIEHLNDPSAFLDEVFRILKPGGRFICTTPNASGLQARLFKSKWRSAIADHMFLFSVKTLSGLLREKSFTVETVKTWGGLGRGYGPVLLKSILDYLAKKLNFGDVMIISSQKR
ncbi:class I SAM-dependent methyltransferase [Spirochaeta isovalerica]|uniref:2-polyprenyl-3-methyl-5-hydroxy-6-metoxy-1, 4-benzoquinol methylase n=1 Tax=Spirochaeta isovalerica TaxID=150 RepID=A0A841RI52_9SPIO|nr:class I SAM-dependent methyltransferase [Spirochaeta isovalerica]MBB6481982.1 2-polyprenyl-3-methyl-5-hydroxy-6-metoxy-1,4-benzoquinol methylase [Spirochaeta isovalerica]